MSTLRFHSPPDITETLTGSPGACYSDFMSQLSENDRSDVGHGSCCAPQSAAFGARRSARQAKARDETRRVARGERHIDTLVTLRGGRFLMGTDDEVGFPDDAEGPVREVTISPFRVDKFPVTNERFQEFVRATGYVTEAEEFGWSFVFRNFVPRVLLTRGMARTVPGLEWWYAVDRATWFKPEGKGSNIRTRMDHPVVHITWRDADRYCEWAGLRLPTEAEWEYAARGGLVGKRYVWGDELTPNGKHMCNIWQGDFPTRNTAADGFQGTCPVKSFSPNEFGLYTVAGNVWEWCTDFWSVDFHTKGPIVDPAGPPTGKLRVMRGGSYLCHSSYCNRYRVAARTSNTPDSSTGNLGFRCAADA